jgi:hypothetical protein
MNLHAPTGRISVYEGPCVTFLPGIYPESNARSNVRRAANLVIIGDFRVVAVLKLVPDFCLTNDALRLWPTRTSKAAPKICASNACAENV